MRNGASYSADYLEQSDYYSADRKIVGQWVGRAAERLGLTGDVRSQDFEALREGLHPETGEQLRPRKSADRIDKNGHTQTQGRALYDLTFSAPKSVSIMACIGGDERLIEVHNRAVRKALLEAEQSAQTRERKNGQEADRFTRNLAAACYVHVESRDLDPQVHTHCATGNLTFDYTEQRWKALQARGIFDRRSYLTEVYRSELARGLEELGYEVVYRANGKNKDRNPEIKGISEDLCRKHSRMSQRRDAAIDAFVEEHGRKPTHNEETVLLRGVRPDKRHDLTPEDVHEIQMERCSAEDLAAIHETRRHADMHRYRPREVNVQASLQHSLDHIFERVSVAKDFEVLAEALRHSRGRATLDQIQAALRERILKGEVYTHKGEITTEASLRRERSTIAIVDDGLGRFDRLARNREFVPSDRLSAKQREAVDFILNSRDLAVDLQGAPGTGKTWTLQEVKRGLEESGRRVFAVAPTKSAEEELGRVGFEHTMTVEGLLQDKDAPLRMAGAVVIIDEAGMVSARQMFELLALASKHSSRVIFSGDTRQLQAIEAGDALRILEKESRLRIFELVEPQRQKNLAYSAAIKAMRDDPDKGFELLQDAKAVTEVSDRDRPEAVAKARREARGETLVVCPTHKEIEAVTEAIRADRRAHNELGDDHNRIRLEPLNYTEAQRRDMRNYEPGQVLVFHRPTKHAQRHEAFEIVSVKDNAVLVRNESGTETEVTQKQARSFGVFAPREIAVAPGDVLLLKGNRRSPDLRATNGEFVEVAQIDAEQRMHLKDGRVLPADYQCYTHGYAITAHKAQGKSIDHVIISGNEMGRELFYVAASRGRYGVQVFTEDAEALQAAAGVTAARQSATELAQSAMEDGVDISKRQQWWLDYETGAPTQDATRAQPQGRYQEKGFSR